MFHADVSRSGAKIRIAEAVPNIRQHDPSADSKQSQLVVETLMMPSIRVLRGDAEFSLLDVRPAGWGSILHEKGQFKGRAKDDDGNEPQEQLPSAARPRHGVGRNIGSRAQVFGKLRIGLNRTQHLAQLGPAHTFLPTSHMPSGGQWLQSNLYPPLDGPGVRVPLRPARSEPDRQQLSGRPRRTGARHRPSHRAGCGLHHAPSVPAVPPRSAPSPAQC